MKTDLHGFFRGSGQRTGPRSRDCGHPGAPISPRMPKFGRFAAFGYVETFSQSRRAEPTCNLSDGACSPADATLNCDPASHPPLPDRSPAADLKHRWKAGRALNSHPFPHRAVVFFCALPAVQQPVKFQFYRVAPLRLLAAIRNRIGLVFVNRAAADSQKLRGKALSFYFEARLWLADRVQSFPVTHALILLSGFRNPQSEIVSLSVFHPCSSVASHV
jgi:hypothetical protein